MATPQPSCDVLLVEDDPDLRKQIARLLEDEGYRVHFADDGRAALRRLRSTPPDIVLLDLMVPVLDGWAVREAMLADPILASIPVIVLTAVSSEHRRQNVLKASAYVPVVFSDLRELLPALRAACGDRGSF